MKLRHRHRREGWLLEDAPSRGHDLKQQHIALFAACLKDAPSRGHDLKPRHIGRIN